jgi:hypothetical protein
LWCLLLVYCKQVYATYLDLYLGHHQANYIKHKLSYLNLVALIWVHIKQYIVVYVIWNLPDDDLRSKHLVHIFTINIQNMDPY